MECIHIERNPGLPRHILPCRHVFCLDCTRSIKGLMDDELFACLICGNYSQYVDAAQTVEGRPGTVATDDHKAEENEELGRIDSPPESQQYDGRRVAVGPGQPRLRDEETHATWSHRRDSDSHEQPMATEVADEASQSRDLDGAPGVSDVTRKDQEILLQQLRESTEQNNRQHRLEASAGSSISERSDMRRVDQLATGEGGDYCKYHQTEKLKYSCSCGKVICFQCTWSDHHRHESVLLEDDNEVDDYQRSSAHGEGHQQEILAQHSKNKMAADGYDVRKLEQRTSVSKSDVSCASHPKSEMFFFCNTCEIAICTHCTKDAHRLHSIIRLDDETNQSGDIDVLRVCPSHRIPYGSFCKSCKRVICITCHDSIYSRYSHTLVPIRKVKDDITFACVTQGRLVREDMAIYKREREASDREAESVRQKAAVLRKMIDNETDRAHRKLNANAAEMNELIDRAMQISLDACESHIKAVTEMEQSLGELETELANAHSLVQSNDVVMAKICAEDVKEKRSDMKKYKKTPPQKSFNLECRSNLIPSCKDNRAPVYLTENRGSLFF